MCWNRRQLLSAFVLLVGGVANGLAADEREALAIKFVESSGWEVERDPNDPQGSVIGVKVRWKSDSDGYLVKRYADLGRLTDFSQLRKLNLSYLGGVGDEGLRHLRGLNRLRILDLTDGNVTDAGLKELKVLPALRELTLRANKAITGSGLAELRGLQVLDLGGTAVGDAGLKELGGLAELEELGLGSLPVTDVGMTQLRPLTKLKYLTLGGTRVTDQGVKELASLSRLESLNLRSTQVTDAGLKSLKGLTKLRALQLGNTAISDVGLAELSGLKNLKALELDDTAVTDEGLKALRTLSALKRVNVRSTKVTEKGTAKLRKFLPEANIQENSGSDERAPVGNVLLLEQATKMFRKVDEIELPSRVYLKMSAKHGKMLHFLSTPYGGLERCEGVLLPGTVVRGDRMGGSRKRYYRLTAVPNWKRVEDPAECREVYITQDDDDEGLSWRTTPGGESALRTKLGEAQEVFHDKLSRVRDQVLPELLAAEEAAKKEGKAEQVAETQRRREEFLLRGAIPDMPAKAELQEQLRSAVAELEKAFDAAKKEEIFYQAGLMLRKERAYYRLIGGAVEK